MYVKASAILLLLFSCCSNCRAQSAVIVQPSEKPEITTPKSMSTSTTIGSNTTTTPKPLPTTTHRPQPFPAPSTGIWNSSCIALRMAAQLNLTYETKDGKVATALYNIPSDAKVAGDDCNSETIQRIALNWGPAQTPASLAMQFDKKNMSIVLSMIKINLPITGDNFPDAKDNETVQLLHWGYELRTPNNNSYHCTRDQHFNLTETIQDTEVVGCISIGKVQVEAFRSKDKDFSTVYDCDSSGTSNVVAIAVGVSLIALICIVLISYLCARRSTARGYLSF
ncbi:lysosome-associated membrane glycoprotein 1-like [Scaptodrosophila lebanonensis]|uniref:Lysosome-associated membrane glycoprotein 5 n=1 Tax=Drosophila lebanonensis TaxID=7225 RepID=A0A6J2TPM5_DROLE|nr:lysosome-associated membrane glycoprotein 1-like [Scaptodrosophila lebanonensis]